ncbi:hypothetical protein [Desulfovibrio sp. Fe33]|uniref:hypothetical protein n=1 Tax=Desulfovibrio sp. Fe33 TaxID=3020842 RepID=UPI00234E1C1B|nr:hypothetical protein [Desulfovibrio sp. Fe33]
MISLLSGYALASDQIRLFIDVRSDKAFNHRHEAFNFGTLDSPSYVIMNGVAADIAFTIKDNQDVVDGSVSLDSVKPRAYSWSTSIWGFCPGECGMASTRVRVVTCEDAGGSVVDDSLCPGGKPASSEPCVSTEACTYVFGDWSAWDGCTGGTDGGCGMGMKTRTRDCLRSDGQTADAALCAGDATELAVCGACAECAAISLDLQYGFTLWASSSNGCTASWINVMTYSSAGECPAVIVSDGYEYFPDLDTQAIDLGWGPIYPICRRPL